VRPYPAFRGTFGRAYDAASHIRVFGEGSGEGVFAKTPSPDTSCLLALLPLWPACGSAPDEFDDNAASEHQGQERQCGAYQPEDRFDALEAFTQAAVFCVAVVFEFGVTFVAATLEIVQPDFQGLQLTELASVLVLYDRDLAVETAQLVAHLFEHNEDSVFMFNGRHRVILD